MTNTTTGLRAKLILLTVLIFASSVLLAEELPIIERGGRFEVWLGATSWPALGDLQPIATGSFDSTGFGLGAGFHVPVRQFENSELLLGLDGFIEATDSKISGVIEDLIARHMYVGGSAKWRFGNARNLSLDAGLGFHLVDIAEVDADSFGSFENEYWESSRLGGFVGATWDFGMNRPDKSRGFFVGLKVHFVDFGSVQEEDANLLPLLGPGAGQLDGPIYILQIGYSGMPFPREG